MAEPIQTKRCYKCKQNKPISEFYKNRSKKDGLCTECKPCVIIDVTNYQKTEKGKDVRHKARRKYAKTEKGKTAQRRYHQSEKGKAKEERLHIRHPERRKSKNAVNTAIQRGKLPRVNTLLCHYGAHPAEQYHHPSYAPEHQLDIIPVCKICHRKIHIYSA